MFRLLESIRPAQDSRSDKSTRSTEAALPRESRSRTCGRRVGECRRNADIFGRPVIGRGQRNATLQSGVSCVRMTLGHDSRRDGPSRTGKIETGQIERIAKSACNEKLQAVISDMPIKRLTQATPNRAERARRFSRKLHRIAVPSSGIRDGISYRKGMTRGTHRPN